MRLNPFGSGTFFIQCNATNRKRHHVLIPLVQGRFLFLEKALYKCGIKRLNPFGSGTFFIRIQISRA